MRKTVIKRSQRPTLRLVGAGVGERASAYSPFGPVRVGLTTTPSTKKEVPLTELLNCLERKITDLNIKSLEVLNTYLSDTIPPVRHTSSSYNTDTTDIL